MATKKEDVKLDIPVEGVKTKLQLARVMLLNENIEKTGDNKFANFKFFQLGDFIPETNKIFVKLGLHSEFNITSQVIAYEEVTTYNENGSMLMVTKRPIIREMATLEITDVQKPEDIEIYEMEVAPLEKGNNTKQNTYQAAGGRNTYYKRYLYMNALELTEDDESDAVLGQEGVNYQQVNTAPNNFMPQPAQPIPLTAKEEPSNFHVANNFVANNITQPINNANSAGWEPQNLDQVANNLENAVEEARQSMENINTPLSVKSKMEIMQMVNKKGLNGAEIISEFCKQNGLKGTNDLLESHKAGLIALINR